MADESLKTPSEWCTELGYEVMDPDGWRGSGGRPWTDPISRAEFEQRLATCTQRVVPVDERAEFRERRLHGLKARHETREARAVQREELDALRALWWFMNDDMGVCDGGNHATLSWAEVTDMNALHDAVEVIYERHGYPPKPAREIGSRDPA